MPKLIQVPRDTWKPREWADWHRSLAAKFLGGTIEDWNPGTLDPSIQLTHRFTLTSATHPALGGLRVGMFVQVSPMDTLPDGVDVAWARVTADDTLQIALTVDSSIAPVAPAIGDWAVVAVTV